VIANAVGTWQIRAFFGATGAVIPRPLLDIGREPASAPRSGGAGPRRRLRQVSAVVCLGLLGGVLALGSARPGGSTGAAARPSAPDASGVDGLSRLRALPLPAQSLISAAVGSGGHRFTATRAVGGWRLAGGGLSARLGLVDVQVRSGVGSLGLRLAGVGRGAHLARAAETSMVGDRNRVLYGGSGLREWFAAGPLGIEQGFTVARPPARGRGAMTVALRLGGSLRAVAVGSEVRFVTRSGRLGARYGGLSAVDATGARLPARLVLSGHLLRLTIDDRGARYPVRIDPFIQQGSKLTGTGESGPGYVGYSVALSADGSTVLVGGIDDNSAAGAAWAFTQSSGVWTQQAELTPSNEISTPSGGEFGSSVALSANGDTALIGGQYDNNDAGAAWVFTRSGTTWSQQAKLLGSNESGAGIFGESAALSSGGNTAVIGGSEDGAAAGVFGTGAAWRFSRSGTTWSQGTKLVGDCLNTCTGPNGTGEISTGHFGERVAVSADGSTALIGGPGDNSGSGAAWLFSLGGTPAQLTELKEGTCTTTAGCTAVGGESGSTSSFGTSVALSSDATTALIGGQGDNGLTGAAWVFTSASSAGPWSQQTELTGPGESGTGFFGQSAALSTDGSTALVGGGEDKGAGGVSGDGAAWAFGRSGTTWSQDGTKLVGDCTTSCGSSGTGESGAGLFGSSIAMSGSGGTAVIGAPADNASVGAAWTFTMPTPTATTTALISSRNPSQIGQSVTFTATVSPTPDAGSVTFTYDNGATLCAATSVSGGVATCQTTFTAGASHPVLATYSGDTAYRGSTSPTVTQVVSGGATTTTLASSSNPGSVGQTITYTATVTPAPDGGTVSFSDGESQIAGCGTVPVSAGKAICSVTYAAVGIHSIIATYSGDASYGAGDTNSLTETIHQAATTITLTSSPNPSAVGQPVTYTAQVSPVPDGGTVRIADLGASVFVCEYLPISATGRATCSITYPNPGPHHLAATYVSDADYDQSFSPTITQTVTLGSYSSSTIAISIAQQAGDPAQTGPNGSSLAYDGVPLVTGRATVARVFADPVGLGSPGTSGLRAVLYGSVNGAPLPGSPLSEDAGGPKALAAAEFDAQLGVPDTAFNFPLPASWTKGKLALRADVQPIPSPPPATTATCPGPCQAALTITSVTFHDVPKFEVTPVEMTWTDKATGTLKAPGDPQAAMALAYHLMPVQKIVNQGYAGTIDETALQSDKGGLGGDQADLDALNLVAQWAANRFVNDCCASTGDLHDMVVGFNVGIARGDTYTDSQLGAITQSQKVIATVQEPVAVVSAPEAVGVAHEMGHAVGRQHADEACGGPGGGGSDPNWPDFRGRLEPTTNFADGHIGKWSTVKHAVVGSYGINPEWRVASASGPGPLMIFPNSDYDYMSYCGALHEANPTEAVPGTVWTSARGWQQEFRCMSRAHPPSGCPINEQQPSQGEIPAFAHAADLAGAAQPASVTGAAISGPSIFFRGYVEPGGALLSPSLTPSSGAIAGPSGSAFSATLLNPHGKLVATEPLASQPMHIDASPGHPAVALVVLQGSIPTHGQTIAGLVLRAAGRVTARITAPRRAPRVSVRTPRLNRRAKTLTLRWSSHDRSPARRTVFISFVITGRRYTTVWEGYDQGRATIALVQFGNARRIRLRVSVSNGFASSAATTRSVRLPARATKASTGSPPAWIVALERDGIQVVDP
jgi:hypothetical protein